MTTLKQFIENSHVNEALIRAVVRQSGGWSEFKEHAEDISNHGASGGFSGFIYYTDTVKFARKHKDAIREALKELADSVGESELNTFNGFNCLKGEAQEDNAKALYGRYDNGLTAQYNALAWFALEEVARSCVEM